MNIFFSVVILGIIFVTGTTAYNIPYSPCNTPLTYTIGSVDQRFGLSPDEVVTDAQNAAGIWNNADGRPLLSRAASSGDLTVNFVYDQRTALDQNVNQLQSQVSEENTTLQQQRDSFENDVSAFEQKLADLNATIQKYNSQGGAPPDVYKNLVQEQDQLKAEGDALNAKARQLNLATQDYNSQVRNLNQNVQEFNQAINQQPEEGLYDGTDKTITIYFANNKEELVHTLAHEFGHALGMDHVTDPEAIMYPYSTASLTVSAEDRNQLMAVCRDIPLPIHWMETVRNRLVNLFMSVEKN